MLDFLGHQAFTGWLGETLGISAVQMDVALSTQ